MKISLKKTLCIVGRVGQPIDKKHYLICPTHHHVHAILKTKGHGNPGGGGRGGGVPKPFTKGFSKEHSRLFHCPSLGGELRLSPNEIVMREN